MVMGSLVGVVIGMRVGGHGGLDSADRSPVVVSGNKGRRGSGSCWRKRSVASA